MRHAVTEAALSHVVRNRVVGRGYTAVDIDRGCLRKCWSKASPMVLSLYFAAISRTAFPSYSDLIR